MRKRVKTGDIISRVTEFGAVGLHELKQVCNLQKRFGTAGTSD